MKYLLILILSLFSKICICQEVESDYNLFHKGDFMVKMNFLSIALFTVNIQSEKFYRPDRSIELSLSKMIQPAFAQTSYNGYGVGLSNKMYLKRKKRGINFIAPVLRVLHFNKVTNGSCCSVSDDKIWSRITSYGAGLHFGRVIFLSSHILIEYMAGVFYSEYAINFKGASTSLSQFQIPVYLNGWSPNLGLKVGYLFK